MGFTYRQVKDLYDTLADAGVTKASLPDWSTEMNKLSGSDLYSEGLHDNIVKRSSVGLDRLLEATGLPEIAAGVGKDVGELVGNPAAGESIGHGLPRMTANFLPFLIPGVGVGAGVARLGGTAALSGADTYTATGSPAAGVLSGATAAALPGVTSKVEQAVLKAMGGRLVSGPLATGAGDAVEQISRYFPTTVRQGVTSQIAGQAAAAVGSEVSGMGQDVLAGQPIHNPLSTETLLNLTLGQVPFAGIYATKGGRAALGGRESTNAANKLERAVAITRQKLEIADAQERINQRTPLESVPDYAGGADPKLTADNNLAIQTLRQRQRELKSSPTELNVDEWNRMSQEENALIASQGDRPGRVVGVSLDQGTPRKVVAGREVYRNKEGTFRLIDVGDDEGNGDLRGKLIGYSTLHEPGAAPSDVAGLQNFSLPEGFYSEFPRRAVPEGTPDLPLGAPAPHPFDHVAAIQDAEQLVKAATTPVEFQDAIVKLNGVRQSFDLPALNDNQIKKRMAVTRQTDPKVAAVDLARKTEREVAALEAVRQGDSFRSEQELRASDESAVADELGLLHELEHSISLKPGKNADKLIAGGELNRLYKDWADGGRKGGFEALARDVLNVARTGKGLTDVAMRATPDAVAKLPKSPETAPLKDVMTEYAVSALNDPVAKRAFDSWEGRSATSFDLEQARFALLYDELGHTLFSKPITGEDVADVNAVLKDSGLEFDNPADLTSFKDRPHVQAWRLATERAALEGTNRAPIPHFQPDAGGGFVWGMEQFDPSSRRLGKHTLPRDGKLRVSQFKNMAGRGKPLPDVEIELAKVIAPGAFDDAGNVDVPKLFKELEKNGLVLEVKKLGGTPENDAKATEVAQAQHLLDTQGYELEYGMDGDPSVKFSGEDVDPLDLPQDIQDAITIVSEARLDEDGRDYYGLGQAQRPKYGFLGPKSEQEMPGYVEGLVRLPTRSPQGQERVTGAKGEIAADSVKYRGPHFGSEDTNVLAFFRGYEETLPDGRKAFHVIEVQSDWGQRQREAQETKKRHEASIIEGRRVGEGENEGLTGVANRGLVATNKILEEGNPLLRVYETLALKAAINHAKEIGADSIVLSDAETAMMTEGHDRNVQGIGFPLQEGEFQQALSQGAQVARPTQEQGMRLHYDTTLPSAMSKLTGEKGQPIDLGTHKSTGGESYRQEEGFGSPVFRTPEGTPKTQITGRLYPLDKAFQSIDSQGGLTVADPNRALRIEPYRPDNAIDADFVKQVGQSGTTLAAHLAESTDPFTRALIADLAPRQKEALERIAVGFASGIGGSLMHEGAFSKPTIVLADSTLQMPPDLRDREYLHELVHGLTVHALNDPLNVKTAKELDGLRQRLIESLPAKLKERFDYAQKSQFLRRYARGEAKISELGLNGTELQIIYGLLDNKELLSQAFSSHEMRNYMRTVKGEGKGTVLARFINWVKTMLGFGENVKGTAFEDFLTHTDALTNSGEYVAGLNNFAERYLEQQGITGTLNRSQAQRAVGLAKLGGYHTTPREMFEALSLPNAFKSEELTKSQRDYIASFNARDEAQQTTAQVLDELGFTSDVSGVDDFLHGVLNGDTPLDAVDLLPGVTSRYLFNRIEDMRQVLDTVRAAASTDGLVNLTDAKGLRLNLKAALKAVDKVLETKKMQDETVAAIQAMFSRTAPDGFLDYATSDTFNPSLRTFLGDAADETQKGTNWISRFLKPPSQMARSNPETAEGIAKGYQLQANARKMASEGLKVLGVDLNQPGEKLTHESVQRVAKTLASPKLEAAVNKWLFANQKQGKETGTTALLPDSHPEVQKALAGLTPKEKSDVVDIVSKLQVSQRMMQAQIVEKMEQIAATNGATLLGRSTGLKVAQNLALSDAVLRAVQTDFSDPVAAQAAQSSFAVVQSKVSPEAFRDLLRYSQLEVEKIKAWREHFDANPAWVSGQRYGKYLVRFRRGQKLFVLGADTKEQARRLAEGGVLESIESNRQGEDDAPPVLGPDAEKLFGRLRKHEATQIEMLEANGVPADDIDAIRRTSPVQQFERETLARQGVPGVTAPVRGLTRGAESVPWLSNHFSWVQKASTYWSRQLFRAQTRAHLLEPEIAGNKELQSWMRTHFDNILQADPESVQKFKRFMTTWFMGYNPASVLVNAAQPFVTHVAELTSMSGKPLDSYRRVLKAMSEIGGHFTGGKDWATSEHSRLMKDAVEALEVGYGKFDDEAAAQESVATNYKRILAGNKPQTLGQRLGTAAGAYSTVGMWMFQQGEQVNNRAALLASFDYYREKGLSYEQARDKAFEFNRAVNFSGGRANRPVGAFSGRGNFARGSAMLGTALQSYVLGTTFQLVRYLKDGLFRPAGLSPGEVHAARKAGVQLLATQLAAAGVLGLPFVSGAIALLDKAFPDLELNRKIREGMSAFLDSDGENGGVLSDVAMTGLPSMFGWDLQSRLSMGNTVPGVSEVNGFQPEQLFGPAASLVSNFVNGGRKLVAGDSNGALAYVPPAVRKLAELIKEDGQVQDYKGRPLFDPTAGEKLGIALGFNPKRLSDFNAAQRVQDQTRLVNNRRESQFRQSLADEVLKGNFGTVRQRLQDKASGDKDYDLVEAVRGVARAAEELQFPRDLRREGDVKSRKLLDAFAIPPSVGSEVARVQFRQQVESRLGLPSSGGRELQISLLMDQLRTQSPGSTRAELRRQAELALRRRSPLEQELQ